MDAVERFKEQLRESGIKDDRPLFGVLLTVYQTTLEARAVVGTGARGLSPQGEQELIDRLAHNAVDVTSQEVERLARKISFRTAMLFGLAGVVLLIVGYLWGYVHGAACGR